MRDLIFATSPMSPASPVFQQQGFFAERLSPQPITDHSHLLVFQQQGFSQVLSASTLELEPPPE